MSDTTEELGQEEARFFSGAALPSQAFAYALGGRVWKASAEVFPLGVYTMACRH